VARPTVAFPTVFAALSNVPAVMLLQPVVLRMSDPHRAWLALTMSSTLAGNLTLVGSIADLIMAEGARRARRSRSANASRLACQSHS
jgi:Na+/H+ antiporter NhaD/arsenite permease-like protein